MKIIDIDQMPGYNSTVSNGKNSVSLGLVELDLKINKYGGINKVICIVHGAMNCVSKDTKIWRCLSCNEGAYVD